MERVEGKRPRVKQEQGQKQDKPMCEDERCVEGRVQPSEPREMLAKWVSATAKRSCAHAYAGAHKSTSKHRRTEQEQPIWIDRLASRPKAWKRMTNAREPRVASHTLSPSSRRKRSVSSSSCVMRVFFVSAMSCLRPSRRGTAHAFSIDAAA
eukprot:5119840-Pleurochrysis_carterae.AAC.1